MNNIRVYEAAKELGLSNKEMIEQLEQKGFAKHVKK